MISQILPYAAAGLAIGGFIAINNFTHKVKKAALMALAGVAAGYIALAAGTTAAFAALGLATGLLITSDGQGSVRDFSIIVGVTTLFFAALPIFYNDLKNYKLAYAMGPGGFVPILIPK